MRITDDYELAIVKSVGEGQLDPASGTTSKPSVSPRRAVTPTPTASDASSRRRAPSRH